jgi:putative ABC transport system substrate-binding protein
MGSLHNHARRLVELGLRPLTCVVASVAILAAIGLNSSSLAEARETRRIGYLTLDSAAAHTSFAAAFRDGLRENGFIEGKNVAIEWRYAEYNAAALPALASELIAQEVELLVTDGTQTALAAKAATRSVPIVAAAAGDLVRAELVASLANPGGNLTGLTLISPGLVGKRLALLKEMAPRTHRVAVLVNP